MAARAVLAAALLAFAWPSATQARSVLRWAPAGTSPGPVVGDGATVAWEDPAGRLVVVVSGRRPRVVTRPAVCARPASPRPPSTPPPLAAAGAGRVLLGCVAPRGTWRYAVVGASSAATVPLDLGYDRFGGAGGQWPDFDQLGEHWLSGPYVGYHVNSVLRLAWRTGATSHADRDRLGARMRPDLSSPALGRRLCRPLQRARRDGDDFETRPPFLPVHVRGAWLLEGSYGSARLQGVLRLRRCGSRAARSLGRGSAALLGRRWLVWNRFSPAGGLRLRRLADGNTVRSRPPGPPFGTAYALTDDAVYASVPTSAGYAIHRARLPAR